MIFRSLHFTTYGILSKCIIPMTFLRRYTLYDIINSPMTLQNYNHFHFHLTAIFKCYNYSSLITFFNYNLSSYYCTSDFKVGFFSKSFYSLFALVCLVNTNSTLTACNWQNDINSLHVPTIKFLGNRH